MDTKNLVDYVLLAIVGYFAATWILGAVQTGVRVAGEFSASPGYGNPAVYPSGFLYGNGAGWGGGWGGSPVRWGDQGGNGGGYTGRPRGAGGY